jgi:hypothetical protein
LCNLETHISYHPQLLTSSTHVEVLRLRVVGVLQPRLLRVDLRMEVPERARRVVDAERAAVLGGVEVGTATGFHLVRLDL